MTNGPRHAPSVRRRTAAALAAAAVLAVGLLVALDQSVAAAPGNVSGQVAPAAPVTTAGTGGAPTLSIDPASGLTSAGATIKAVGSGFDTEAGLYVAICQVHGNAAPNVKTDCVGGPIPAANPTTAWAHITSSGVAVPGQVSQKWNDKAGFSVDLTLPASDSSSDGLDCSKVVCAVITTPDAGTDKTQMLSIPITYAAATTTTPTPPTTPTTPSSTPTTTSSQTTTSQVVSTSTIEVVGTTVQPNTIDSASVVAGGQQEVLFAGFAKNEVVSVTLYSAPITLPDARADSDGIVKIDFTVPADLPPGTHLLKAVGKTSKVTGVASFEVTAPVVKSTALSSTVASSSAPASSAPASSAAVAPLPVVSSVAASSSAAPSSRLVAVLVRGAPAKSRLVWPWYVLGVVVLLWVGVAIFMVQRRRKRLAAENREKERILAEASVAEQQRAADALAAANSNAPTAYIGPLPGDQPEGYLGYHPGEHGLLSGRDHPDNPGMMSGRGEHPGSTGEQPTTQLPPASGAHSPPPPGSSARPQGADPAAGGPPTGAWTPDFAPPPSPGAAGSTPPQPPGQPGDSTAVPPGEGQTDSSGGPGTSQWRPDFDDEDDGGDDSGGGRHSR